VIENFVGTETEGLPYKLLKPEGLCSSGGEAKLVIADGKVNGEIETSKRGKLQMGIWLDFLVSKY
jgi:ribosome-associated protein